VVKVLQTWVAALTCVTVILSASALFGDAKPDRARPGPKAGPAVTAETLTDEQVVAAMKRAMDYLFAAQDKDGVWETPSAKGDKWVGGYTGVCTYALLHAATSLDDPRLALRSKEMAKPIGYLRTLRNDYFYVRVFQILVMSMLPQDAETKKALAELSRDFFRVPANGMSSYTYENVFAAQPANAPIADTSVTQLAVLAAWAAEGSGIEISMGFWGAMNAYWRKTQKADGGWAYNLTPGRKHPMGDKSYLAMTAAGFASLAIIQDQLDGAPRLTAQPDKAMESSLAWLNKNYDPREVAAPSHNYALYALERVGLATGRKYIGGHDWYREAAAHLIRTQRADGSWPALGEGYDGNSPLAPTAFALIFLSRGRNPIAFNKLEYPGVTWNARPSDVAHATHWMGRQFERAVNWQVVTLESKPVEWLDAPVLVITGSSDPKFSPEQVARLRTFVEAGGMILSTADGGREEFTRAMQTYATAVGQGQYEMRELPTNHLVYSAWGKVNNPGKLRMLGLSNGARELWIHSPGDLSAIWATRAYARGADEWTLTANVFFYAAGATQSLTPRLRPLERAAAKLPAARVKAQLARIAYAGNWNPEPGAWPRLAAQLAREGVAVEVRAVKIADLDAAKHRVAHLTGTARFTLSDEDVQRLRAYTQGGGTLVMDVCGGGEAFRESVEKLAAQVFPEQALQPLAVTDVLFKGDYAGGVRIEEVARRRTPGPTKAIDHKPNMLAVEVGGRAVLLFVPEDVTSGLLGTQTLGINGYTPASAVNVARAMVFGPLRVGDGAKGK